jgi:hypothetical protein
MAQAPQFYNNGHLSFFTNAKGEASWTLAADDVDSWLEALLKEQKERFDAEDRKKRGASKVDRGSTSPLVRKTKSKIGAGASSASASSSSAASASGAPAGGAGGGRSSKQQSAAGSWAVKIHADTGQVFYTNKESAESVWYNPLASGPSASSTSSSALSASNLVEEGVNPVDKIFAENWQDWLGRKDEELEQVAGFALLVDPK